MKPFTAIAAAIFLLMALVHLYRIVVGFPITIGGTGIGQEVSWAGLIVTSVMAAGLFREFLRGNPHGFLRGNHHDIILDADFSPADPKQIRITRKTKLRGNSGGHHFKFILDDKTGKNVEFLNLTSADDCSTCPPAKGKANTQIYKFQMDNAANPHSAEFWNRNDNEKPQPVPMDVCYQWEFKCSDPSIKVLPFDPIISNGGKT